MENKNFKNQYIQLAINFSDLVRTTLGPKGMNKLVLGKNPVMTNDGATIIKSINADDPISLMFKNLAKNQEQAVGDGTTSTTILAGQFLSQALELLNKGMHRVTIINGFNLARNAALYKLNELAIEEDKKKIVLTTFGSKIPKDFSEKLANLIEGVDTKNLKMHQLENEDPSETEIIKGFAFEGFTVNDRMPKEAEGKIAVLDLTTNMENAKMAVQTSEELVKVNQQFRKFKKDIVNKLKENQVKVLFYSDTNPELESLLTQADIMAVVTYDRVKLDSICKTTGANAIADPESDYSQFVGYGKVRYLEGKKTIIVENENSPVSTLILRGQTKELLDETHRAVDDVIGVLKNMGEGKKNKIVGAGAVEVQLSLFLKEYAKQIVGKEQAAVEKYAEALESIPLILAQNCGLDAMDILSKLKSAHVSGLITLGVDDVKGISCAKERGVLEPLKLKTHAISSATDVANLILKLDDVYKGVEEGNE